MNVLRLLPLAIAFAAGIGVAHIAQPVRAASTALQAATYDLSALQSADLPAPGSVTPKLQSKLLVATDTLSAALQIGTVFKHVHTDANEIQIVLAGSGTEWLGDTQVTLKPGLLVIIPAGTPHGGTIDPNLKILTFKTPPQSPSDIHPVP